MKCFYCPMIEEELWSRIDSMIRIMGHIPDAEELENEIISYCWCDKNGHKIWAGACPDRERITEQEWSDYCDKIGLGYDIQKESFKQLGRDTKDILEYEPEITKRQKKRLRDQKYKRKLRMLWHECSGWGSGAYPVDINGDYINDDEKEFVRYKRQYNPRRAKYFRRISNKKIRKGNDIPLKGSGYKRSFDLLWELW